MARNKTEQSSDKSTLTGISTKQPTAGRLKDTDTETYTITAHDAITHLRKYLKPYVKPFIVVAIIYTIAMISIIRANYSYMDDNGRAINGYAWNFDFNRITSSLLGYVLNTNLNLSDISPLPQILAILSLSITSLIITKVFCAGKIKYPQLISSCLIGLTPFMYGCWVFKFDAPCMAISLLASVTPLLAWDKLNAATLSRKRAAWAFATTVLCMMIMWTSYQASSGILPVFVVGLAVLELVRGAKIKDILLRCSFYATAYATGVLLFKLIFPNTNGAGYRATDLFSITELLPGVIGNIKGIFLAIKSSLNAYWILLIAVIIISYLVGCASYCHHKAIRLKNLLVSIVGLSLMFFLSYGAYLVLCDAPTNGRSLVGIGAVLAAVAIIGLCVTSRLMHICLCLTSTFTVYSFLVYGLAFGNALASQEKYADFRINTLITELIVDDIGLDSGKKIRLDGDIGPSSVMAHILQTYPITSKLFDLQSGLNDLSIWGYHQLVNYYGIDLVPDEQKTITCNKLISSSRYYKISSDTNGNVCVEIK